MELLNKLKQCSPSQFAEVMLRLPIDPTHVSTAPAIIAQRALELLQLVKQQPSGLELLRAALGEVALANHLDERAQVSVPGALVVDV